ncbi:zinc finger protein 787-like [Cynara cardunculus var. scolymus]|uniref:zinc finger protein 787-like n=1 Tax=Cynara cardunculus var. scolymus TaxID=59895 RepID=UPI000D62FB44|nr:zinc finger protein 787-like [Cynara cardunculus var. scolymus]
MEEEDQEQKCYVCKFCNQSFLNGKKLGGHMRGHLALISATKKQSIKEHDQEAINGGMSLEFNDEMIKKKEDFGPNSYGLRENPKKSWRVSVSGSKSKPNRSSDSICKQCGKGFLSLRALASHMRSHSLKSKESIKKNLCGKCGKCFDSVKALYEDGKLDGGVKGEIANPIRRKRSCTRYKPVKPNDPSSCNSLSSFASICEDNGDEVEEGALCLMMISRGIMGISKKEVMGQSGFGFGFGSGQPIMDLTKNNPKSNSQHSPDKGKRKAFDELCDTRRSKDHKCPICSKEFGSGQALGGHKKAHCNMLISTENGVKEDTDDSFDVHECLDHGHGIKNDGVELKLTWVGNNIEWDPLLLVN